MRIGESVYQTSHSRGKLTTSPDGGPGEIWLRLMTDIELGLVMDFMDALPQFSAAVFIVFQLLRTTRDFSCIRNLHSSSVLAMHH